MEMEYEGVDQREAKLLAPYAWFSRQSAGRHYPEPEHPYRGPYQRDRDRIVHSAAFRRLSGKMQVFTGDMGDYHRTRLTHTMEVASIARTIGRALRLNEDLIEALALLHDLGHPPFGHAGEDALHECLADEGGFSHNQFALTLVQVLEQRYPDFPGLNLTLEVLAGQRTRLEKQSQGRKPILEVQVVEVADGIAYNSHDVDDALKLELVTLEQLAEVPPLGHLLREVQRDRAPATLRLLRQVIVRRLLDYQVGAVLAHCAPVLRRCQWSSSEEASQSDFSIELPLGVAAERAALAEFLHHHIYRHPKLMAVRGVAQSQIAALHKFYVAHPDSMPIRFQNRADRVGRARSAAEYIAGMTDRYCREQYLRHHGSS